MRHFLLMYYLAATPHIPAKQMQFKILTDYSFGGVSDTDVTRAVHTFLTLWSLDRRRSCFGAGHWG